MNTTQEQIEATDAANKAGKFAEAEAICRELLAEELQLEQRVTALLYLSESLWQRGLAQEAVPFSQEALSIAEELENKELQAKTLGSLGIVYSNLSDYPRALEYCHQALAINKHLGNKRGIVVNLGSLGIVYTNLSEYSRALENCHQALAIQEELGNKTGIANNLGSMGNVYKKLSDYPRALEYHHQALVIQKELGNKSSMAGILGNIGILYSYLSDHLRALECFQQALAIFEEICNKSGVANTLGNIGVIYSYLSDYTHALDNYHQALAIQEELGNKIGIANNLGSIGIVYATSDFVEYNPSMAEEYLIRSLAISQEMGTKHHTYEVCKSLSYLYAQEERWQEHAEYLRKYYETEKEVQTKEAKKQADKFAFERQIAVMEKEREVTDMLLHKFLPSPIVNEVKAKEGKILVEKYESVSVLFADLVGFTKLSLQIPPEVMIEILNFIFTKFDSSIKEAGGHRIRTIGDGYFAVCGAPDRVEQHQYKLAKAALQFMEDIMLPDSLKGYLPESMVLDIRIGLHCGEAVCGMVGGLEKWQYDAYGDTINTASRMESHGEAGKVHISENFKNALVGYPEFTFIAREPMTIKGKGTMNTYFIE